MEDRMAYKALSVLALWFACVQALLAVTGQNPFLQVKKLPLTVTAAPGLSSTWKVKAAYLEEDLSATTGYLDVQNVSSEDIPAGNFYAEYYDALGRLCFSLLFSLDKNVEKRNGSFAPTEVRKLYSITVYIAPAVEPTEVRLLLLAQPISKAGQHFPNVPPIQAPITIQATSPSNADFWLGSEVDSADGQQVIDLILAELTVDSSGHIQNVETLDANSDKLKSWFSKFVATLGFYPATTGGAPVTGKTLLLIRSVVLRKYPNGVSFQATDSPWVLRYAAHFKSDTDVPPINVILFERPPTRVKEGGSEQWTKLPPAPPGLFQLRYGSSEWCPGISVMARDPMPPNYYRREFLLTPSNK